MLQKGKLKSSYHVEKFRGRFFWYFRHNQIRPTNKIKNCGTHGDITFGLNFCDFTLNDT